METIAVSGEFREQPEQPRYHVVSMRVSDAEKALLHEMSIREQTNITNIMRMAIQSYFCLSR